MVVKKDCSLRSHLASRKTLVLLASCWLAAQVGQVAAEAVCTPEHIARMIQNEVPDNVIREVCADAGVDVDAVAPDAVETAVEPAEVVREERQHERERIHSGRDEGPRQNFFGVGLYNLRLTFDYGGGRDSENYTGLNLFFSRAFHQRWSGDLGLYWGRHIDYSDATVSGFDSALWLSTNALNPGWNFGVGFGLYTESWSNYSFHGYQFGFLIGYRGGRVGFDLKLKGRDTSDQEGDFKNVDIHHGASSLNFLYQF
ncbi:hypothetical protein [Halorhodospira abdelmalekii]|uniref:hypothetical protein n=1 Tax=Halorhodospira abdelmalekii TaxID=421629 RepID=UPI00190654B2|nr:hypothetical protein [Halorhodospira abdelmalekii]